LEIAKVIVEIDEKQSLIQEKGEEIYQMTFEKGSSFGEASLQTGKGRGGTCIAVSTCYCGLVGKESYMKILNKMHIEKQHRTQRFLR
jgi:hypothetical protein